MAKRYCGSASQSVELLGGSAVSGTTAFTWGYAEPQVKSSLRIPKVCGGLVLCSGSPSKRGGSQKAWGPCRQTEHYGEGCWCWLAVRSCPVRTGRPLLLFPDVRQNSTLQGRPLVKVIGCHFTCGHGLGHAVTSVFGRVRSRRYCITAGIWKDTSHRSSIHKIGDCVGVEDHPADVMTKAMGRSEVFRLLRRVGVGLAEHRR